MDALSVKKFFRYSTITVVVLLLLIAVTVAFSLTLVAQSQSSNLLTPTIPPNRCVYVLFAGSISGEGGAVGGIYDCERWKE